MPTLPINQSPQAVFLLGLIPSLNNVLRISPPFAHQTSRPSDGLIPVSASCYGGLYLGAQLVVDCSLGLLPCGRDCIEHEALGILLSFGILLPDVTCFDAR